MLKNSKISKKQWKKVETKINQSGYSLIELILVLGISTIAFLGVLSMEQHKTEVQTAENAGGQFLEMGQVLSSYINKESAFLKTSIPVGGEILLPLAALTNPSGTTMSGGISYPNHQFLPRTYTNDSILNTKMIMAVKNNTGNVLTGLVISNSPILDASGAVRYDYMGAAIKKMGAQGGMTFIGGPNTLSGLAAAWSLTNIDFTEINTVGLLGYRVQYQSDYDAAYLRLDGQYPMVGNLNMGDYSIKNVTDISYIGWLYGNNAVFNNIITGTITNSGNIQTNSINGTTTPSMATAVANASGGAPKNYANFDLIYSSCINCGINGEGPAVPPVSPGDINIGSDGNHGELYVKDVVLGANANRGDMSNTKLSDHLSRYSDRGIIVWPDGGPPLPKPVVNSGVPIAGYACNYIAGKTPPVPKIELILQSATTTTPLPSINMAAPIDGAGNYNITATPSGPMVSNIEVYAVDLGASWDVHINTNGVPSGGTALAHIYCDYGI